MVTAPFLESFQTFSTLSFSSVASNINHPAFQGYCLPVASSRALRSPSLKESPVCPLLRMGVSIVWIFLLEIVPLGVEK